MDSFLHLAHEQGAFVRHPASARTWACCDICLLDCRTCFHSLCCNTRCLAQVRSSIANDTEVFGEAVAGDVANERVLDDFSTGLNTTTFCVTDVQPIERLAIRIVIEFYCNAAATPWCTLQPWL